MLAGGWEPYMFSMPPSLNMYSSLARQSIHLAIRVCDCAFNLWLLALTWKSFKRVMKLLSKHTYMKKKLSKHRLGIYSPIATNLNCWFKQRQVCHSHSHPFSYIYLHNCCFQSQSYHPSIGTSPRAGAPC